MLRRTLRLAALRPEPEGLMEHLDSLLQLSLEFRSGPFDLDYRVADDDFVNQVRYLT